MTKQKKSFLDKITGHQENKINKEENEIKQDDSATLQNIETNDNNTDEKNIDNNQKEGEEWLDSKEKTDTEEGQLTVDVYQTKSLIIIKSIIGGVASEDIDISITSDMITIKGTRANPDEVNPDDYYYQECFWGCFSRSIILPCDIKTEGVEATMKNGILTVKLPKIEKNSQMKVTVKEE